jgi:hypothetical protein
VEIAAPAILVRQHVPVTGRYQIPRRRDRQLEQHWSQIVAGLAPIKARVRDHNFNAADEKSKKAQCGDPVSNTHEGRMPRSSRCGWDGRENACVAGGVSHAGMVACGTYLAHTGAEHRQDSYECGFLPRPGW